MIEAISFISFKGNDKLIVAEPRFRCNGDDFEIYDMVLGWIKINVDLLVRENLLESSQVNN